MSKDVQSNYFRTRANRRQLLRRGLLGAGGLAAASLLGCSGEDDGNGAPAGGGASTGSSPATGGGTPKSGGTLRLGHPTDIVSLERHLQNAQQFDNLWPIWDTLTRYDHNLEVSPALAESWEVQDEGLTFVLRLRDGVKYHSGRDFTSEDVLWNFERVRDPDVGAYAQFRNFATWFPVVEAPERLTVVLKSEKPRPAAFDFLEMFGMTDRVSLEGSDAARTAVGTGPWMYKEWRQGASFEVVRNPEYWGGAPYLDGLLWTHALDAETMIAQIEGGALDVAHNPPVTGFLRLRESNQFQTIVHPSPGAYYVAGFNQTIAPFGDKRVRQAFNWAFDRGRFADLILRNIVEPHSLPWPPTSLAYEEEKDDTFSFDLDEAAKLLRAANASDISTSVLLATARPELNEFMPIWQADLKTIGVDMAIQTVEIAAFSEAVNSKSYDAVYIAGSAAAGFRSPSMLFVTSPHVWSGDGNNNQVFTNARYDELVKLATEEIDPEKQKTIFSELNDIILDECHLITPASQPIRLGLAANVNGVTHHMHDGYDYSKAWLA